MAICAVAVMPVVARAQTPQSVSNSNTVPVQLTVTRGTPLRLYLTKRVSFKKNAPVEARLAEPVWTFDRIVIPAGTLVRGRVAATDPVPKSARAAAMVRGDFTPLKVAKLSFDTIVMPGGRELTIDTQSSAGLPTLYSPSRAAKQNAQPATASPPPAAKGFAKLRQTAKQQAQTQWNSSTQNVIDVVRGHNKREWVENFLLTKLPYHPQWYLSRTRFDAVINKPIDFDEVQIPEANLKNIGKEPGTGVTASVRLITSLNSSDAKVGDPVKGVLSQPVFSSSRQLLLPEGSAVSGKVTMVRRARIFHRAGQLRFNFEKIDVPVLPAARTPAPEQRVVGQLEGAEQQAGKINIDEEGTAKANEPKTRFLRTAVAGLMAGRSMDDDRGTNSSGAITTNANYSGRALGGFSGFGLFGTAVAFGPRDLGIAFGFYGLAWSAFTNIVSRGSEVAFDNNSATTIRFAPDPAHSNR